MQRHSAISALNPSLTLLEPFRAAMELTFHQFAPPPRAAPGDGHPVVIFPGLGADGTSVSILRAHCQELGYEAFDWGLGFNTGPLGQLDTWLEGLADQISGQLAKHTKTATFIGWSLGGLYARELGKLLAPRVRQVITIATPFNGSADDIGAGWLSSVLGGSAASIDPTWIERFRIPPPIRTTSIYSRSDGVVAWETCCHDEQSRLVQDVEVNGSHMGMGWNREVLNIVADRLAQDAGPWRPCVGTT
jgi:pimeloyl-ACP methyl ester carboxylesterase